MTNTLPYSAHIGYLFQELPFLDRVRAAKLHGFAAVEHPSPYATPASDLADCLSETGASYIQFGLRSGDASKGEKGIAIFPERWTEFTESVEEGILYARKIGVKLLHAMAGVVPSSARTDENWEQYIQSLRYAAERAEEYGITIIVEPMCHQAVPDYYVETPEVAARAIAAAGKRNIGLLLDVFHVITAGLDLDGQIRRYREQIKHVHISDVPGRHEPGTGTIDFKQLKQTLLETQYRGYLGCEYIPRSNTIDGLNWM
ncbi:MAG: TIM barrel protein [Acidobacteriaceae bacterium]|nr:TIM barrel protein [Acidobacteriaceae bacterium]